MIVPGVILAMNLYTVGVSASQTRRVQREESNGVSLSAPGKYATTTALVALFKPVAKDVAMRLPMIPVESDPDDNVPNAGYWNKVDEYIASLGPLTDEPLATDPEPII